MKNAGDKRNKPGKDGRLRNVNAGKPGQQPGKGKDKEPITEFGEFRLYGDLTEGPSPEGNDNDKPMGKVKMPEFPSSKKPGEVAPYNPKFTRNVKPHSQVATLEK